MRILITGSSGHLGEALVRTLPALGHEVLGLDILPSATTDRLGSVADRAFVDACMAGVDAVVHTATLHKPHVATHSRQQFVETNITGTLNLLESAVDHGVSRFVFTSTTSAFGAALRPGAGEPAVWVDESLRGVPKNVYGVTKTAAEDLCQLLHRRAGLPVVVLRTSRFFREADDDPSRRTGWVDENVKANEFLNRRADIEDMVGAHVAALRRAPDLGFGRYIISATTPFRREHLARLRRDAPGVLAEVCPRYVEVYRDRGYAMFGSLGRVYDNTRAREELGWEPRWSFGTILDQLARNEPMGSALGRAVGAKGYHAEVFEDGPYPVVAD